MTGPLEVLEFTGTLLYRHDVFQGETDQGTQDGTDIYEWSRI